MIWREGMQLQSRKVGDAGEEGSRHIDDTIEANSFKSGQEYNIRERIFHFIVKMIPIPKLGVENITGSRLSNPERHCVLIIVEYNNRERLQTAERESENVEQGCAIYPLGNCVPTVHGVGESDRSDKCLNDWILDEELVDPLASFVASDSDSGEQKFATRMKERGGNQAALFEQIGVITTRCNDIVDDILREFHRFCHM